METIPPVWFLQTPLRTPEVELFIYYYFAPEFGFNATEIQAGLCRMSEGSACYQLGRAGARAVDGETDSVSRCCPESGSRILGLFVLPVTWCHCDRCSTRCVPYGQLGSDGEKGLFYKTQIVTRSQIKYCCLWKKNELKIRAISILVQKRSLIHGKQGVLLPW